MPRLESLRSQLLAWLLLPLAAVGAFDIFAAHRSALETATIVQERMLVGAARMIGEQVRLQDGILDVVVPPAALELFASPSRDRVFYRVTGRNDTLLTGYYELPLPATRPAAEEALFFDAQLRDRPVHVAAFAQPVLDSRDSGQVLVEVGQTLGGRDALARQLWLASLERHALLLVMAGLLLWWGLSRALRPVLTLRDRVLAFQPGTVNSLDVQSGPSELRPLLTAFNDYGERLERHVSMQSRFIADASHQLRTPLTLLNTQVSYAMRNEDAKTRQETLFAIQDTVQHGIRLVRQLLSFTNAEAGAPGAPRPGPVDLVRVVTAVLERAASLAADRKIDLGFECSVTSASVIGHEQLLAELASNLIDNALRYTPPGGRVTVSIGIEGDCLALLVTDNGPGIAPSERERAFERFCRLENTASDGCGLGLSIVREIARLHGASVTLGDVASGPGLRVSALFPGRGAVPAPLLVGHAER